MKAVSPIEAIKKKAMFLVESPSEVYFGFEHPFFACPIGRISKFVRLKSQAPRKKFVHPRKVGYQGDSLWSLDVDKLRPELLLTNHVKNYSEHFKGILKSQDSMGYIAICVTDSSLLDLLVAVL